MLYWILRFIGFVLFKIFFNGKVYGREYIPRAAGFIVASNHASFFDPVVVGVASQRRLNYMARDTLFSNFFFGKLLSGVSVFPVKRGATDIGALREAMRRVRQGGGLLIFPQGTRGADAERAPKGGIGFLAAKLDAPVVPAYVLGTDKACPKGAKRIRLHPISVRFGAPIRIEKGKSYQEFAEEVLRHISDLKA